MATATLDFIHADVSAAYPANGQGAVVQNAKNVASFRKSFYRSYTLPTVGTSKFIIMGRIDEKVSVRGGAVYSDGQDSTGTVDVGFIPVSTLDDTNANAFGAAIPLATAGAYPLVGGLASGTGKPANLGIEITVPSYIVVKTNTAGFTAGKILKLELDYVSI